MQGTVLEGCKRDAFLGDEFGFALQDGVHRRIEEVSHDMATVVVVGIVSVSGESEEPALASEACACKHRAAVVFHEREFCLAFCRWPVDAIGNPFDVIDQAFRVPFLAFFCHS